MGEVISYLVDGTSGIAPGGVDGKAIVTGVCSRGEIGKGYIIGKRTNLSALLGTGPLVDRVRDILATGSQDIFLVAVPVQGQPGGYVSSPHIVRSKVKATTLGIPQKNANIEVKVSQPGELSVAKIKVSLDGGKTYNEQNAATAIPLGDSGATLCFPSDSKLEEDASFRVIVRKAVGYVKRFGHNTSPMISVIEGDKGVLAGAELSIQIIKSGARNEGTYRCSVDGGDNYGKIRTIPLDGKVLLNDYGVSVSFPEGTYEGGTTYTCQLLPPVPSIVDVMAALESPLSLYDVEFVHIAGPSNSVDWAAAGAKANELWNKQQPTYFKMETRLPYDGEDLNDYAAYLISQRQNFAERFVIVCTQFGEITDADGERRLRNWCGLQSGRVLSIPVMRATGRVKDGPIVQGSLPNGWEALQPALEEAGFVTARKHAGLKGCYWADSRTLAEDTSDFRYEEVVRTVFKAVRKSRIAALKSLYDEQGDPLLPSDRNGEAYLQTEIENALDSMVKARPKELAGYKVVIPSGQDKVNNGVGVEITFIGIGIMREIKLFFSYVYAGGRFDPRLELLA